MTDRPDDPDAAAFADGYDAEKARKAGTLLTLDAVRERCARMLELAEDGKLTHVSVDLAALAPAADRIVAHIRARWPDLVLPFHSVWRRFEAGGHDRFADLAGYRQWSDVREMGRAAFDMALVAGFLGHTAPPRWAYAEGVTAERYRDAEGLAVAGLAMIASGLLSGVPMDPLRADAGQLARLGPDEVAAALQMPPDNTVIDIEARMHVLRRLGEAVNLRDDLFAREDDPRPGGLFDLLFEEGLGAPLEAARIFEVLIDGLAPVFAGGAELGGIPLGDTWRCEVAARQGDDPETAALLPFHSRIQRLVPDLAEPLVWAGVEIVGLEALTAQSDETAASLLIDTGVVSLRDETGEAELPPLSSPATIELRAVTVALFDRLAPLLRERLGVDADEMPLAGLLEGGIRQASGEIALEKRGEAARNRRFAGSDALL